MTPTAAPKKRKAANQWISTYNLYEFADVTRDEYKKASKKARKDILRGARPVGKGTKPHIIVTIGAPGSGKSISADAIAPRDGAGYIHIDYDLAVKYHPRFLGIWKIPVISAGKPIKAGIAMGYMACMNALGGMLSDIFMDLIFESESQYNIVLQSHNQLDIARAKMAGYRVTLLFVGVPLAVAIRRSRERAIETGKFLAATLESQDADITGMFNHYAIYAPWYGLWADEFVVVDNRREAKTDGEKKRLILATAKTFRLHEKDTWNELVETAWKATDAATEKLAAKKDTV